MRALRSTGARADAASPDPTLPPQKEAGQKAFDRRDMEGRIALLCRPCHGNVHAVFENKDLEREYNTVDALEQHPGIQRFTRWIRKNPTAPSRSNGRTPPSAAGEVDAE